MENKQTNKISNFVKYNRKKLKCTQEDLAKKAGVGLRFFRELEQGKESLRLDKVNQVLALFGNLLIVGNSRILDPYEILLYHMNRKVKIFLKNRLTINGILLEPIKEYEEITAWKFVLNKNTKIYNKTKDSQFEEVIKHKSIENIENT